MSDETQGCGKNVIALDAVCGETYGKHLILCQECWARCNESNEFSALRAKLEAAERERDEARRELARISLICMERVSDSEKDTARIDLLIEKLVDVECATSGYDLRDAIDKISKEEG